MILRMGSIGTEVGTGQRCLSRKKRVAPTGKEGGLVAVQVETADGLDIEVDLSSEGIGDDA